MDKLVDVLNRLGLTGGYLVLVIFALVTCACVFFWYRGHQKSLLEQVSSILSLVWVEDKIVADIDKIPPEKRGKRWEGFRVFARFNSILSKITFALFLILIGLRVFVEIGNPIFVPMISGSFLLLVAVIVYCWVKFDQFMKHFSE